jgi:diguanylate cyclase (GGDEF)-like protein/PAS domain S-box-containing protein
MSNQSQLESALALIVDDDTTVRIVMRSVLESHGIRVNEAGNGIEALQSFDEETPDIVILDIEMPEKDGLEACADIRHHSKGKLVPIMMSTGMDDTDSINRAYEAGATDFAVKPLNWPIFGHRIRYMLQAARAIREHHAALQTAIRLGKVVESSSNEVYICDDHTLTLQQTNGRARANTRYEETEINQLTLAHLLPELTEIQLKEIINELYRGKYNEQLLSTNIQRKSGTTYPAELSLQLSREDDNNLLVVIAQDITERQLAENRMRQLAYYDTLTGLPNRQLFTEQLEKMLAKAKESTNKIVVLYIDIDNFKRINDSLGHSIGDKLLQEIAIRLTKCISDNAPIARHISTQTEIAVSRLSGDEFALVLDLVEDTAIAGTIAKYLLNALSRPMQLEGHELVVTLSIGIAVAPVDSDNEENLLKHADTAMHHAKKAGKNTFQYYSSTMNSMGRERLQLEAELRRAMERQELTVFYQPQIDIQTGKMVSAEALVRWKHPQHGLVSPAHFIPLAEEMGLIIDIGGWVLNQACSDLKAWQTKGLSLEKVAVNLSSLQFNQSDLVTQTSKILQETGLDAKYLELELTESVIMNDANTTIEILHALKEMGIRLSVDDFGTGYSSLNYLSKFPLDELKIDKSFIVDVDSDSHNASIVTAIVAMANSLNLELVAEGVETESQLAFVHEQGVRLVQGFYFSKPVAAMEFKKLLQQNHFSTPST